MDRSSASPPWLATPGCIDNAEPWRARASNGGAEASFGSAPLLQCPLPGSVQKILSREPALSIRAHISRTWVRAAVRAQSTHRWQDAAKAVLALELKVRPWVGASFVAGIRKGTIPGTGGTAEKVRPRSRLIRWVPVRQSLVIQGLKSASRRSRNAQRSESPRVLPLGLRRSPQMRSGLPYEGCCRGGSCSLTVAFKDAIRWRKSSYSLRTARCASQPPSISKREAANDAPDDGTRDIYSTE